MTIRRYPIQPPTSIQHNTLYGTYRPVNAHTNIYRYIGCVYYYFHSSNTLHTFINTIYVCLHTYMQNCGNNHQHYHHLWRNSIWYDSPGEEYDGKKNNKLLSIPNRILNAVRLWMRIFYTCIRVKWELKRYLLAVAATAAALSILHKASIENRSFSTKKKKKLEKNKNEKNECAKNVRTQAKFKRFATLSAHRAHRAHRVASVHSRDVLETQSKHQLFGSK